MLTRFLVALAPILSFTTEEAWQSLPEALRGDTESVFDLSLGAPGANADDRSADLALGKRCANCARRSPRARARAISKLAFCLKVPAEPLRSISAAG